MQGLKGKCLQISYSPVRTKGIHISKSGIEVIGPCLRRNKIHFSNAEHRNHRIADITGIDHVGIFVEISVCSCRHPVHPVTVVILISASLASTSEHYVAHKVVIHPEDIIRDAARIIIVLEYGTALRMRKSKNDLRRKDAVRVVRRTCNEALVYKRENTVLRCINHLGSIRIFYHKTLSGR